MFSPASSLTPSDPGSLPSPSTANISRLIHSWGYNRLAAWLACSLAGLVLIIVRRLAGTTGFVVQPRRWVVERSFGWFGRWRRLSKHYEVLPEVSAAMLTLAVIRLMLHRLAHPNRRRLPAP